MNKFSIAIKEIYLLLKPAKDNLGKQMYQEFIRCFSVCFPKNSTAKTYHIYLDIIDFIKSTVFDEKSFADPKVRYKFLYEMVLEKIRLSILKDFYTDSTVIYARIWLFTDCVEDVLTKSIFSQKEKNKYEKQLKYIKEKYNTIYGLSFDMN